MPREYTSSCDKFLNPTELYPRGMGDLKPFDKALLTLTFFFYDYHYCILHFTRHGCTTLI